MSDLPASAESKPIRYCSLCLPRRILGGGAPRMESTCSRSPSRNSFILTSSSSASTSISWSRSVSSFMPWQHDCGRGGEGRGGEGRGGEGRGGEGRGGEGRRGEGRGGEGKGGEERRRGEGRGRGSLQ